MKSIEISEHASLEAMAPDTQHELATLIRLGKLSTEDITDYDGWLLAHASESDTLVGCVGVELRPPHVYMESLVVHPDARRQGLGGELTRRVFELYVADTEMSDLTAMTLFWNNQFYEALGFGRINPRVAKIADDVAAKEKHRYCTVWRKT